MNEPVSVPSLFAVWRVFHNLPSWFYARGCPPTIEPLTGWPRVRSVCILMSTLGFLVGFISVLLSGLLLFSDVYTDNSDFLLGALCGGLLILPLSLWNGRPWWWAILLALAATIWWGLYSQWQFQFQIYFETSNFEPFLTTAATWSVMGLGIGLLPIARRQQRIWRNPVLATLVGLFTAALNSLSQLWLPDTIVVNGGTSAFGLYLLQSQSFVLMLVLLANVLGMTLWKPVEAQSSLVDEHADDLFALWRTFYGLPRWFFARGCPPTIAHLTGDARRLHILVLLGAMGLVSSWISTACIALGNILPAFTGSWNDAPLVFAPGLCFGVLVLVPLSRWLDRGWIRSLLLVPVSMGFYYSAAVLFMMSSFNPDQFPVNWLGSAACGLWGGFGVSLGLIHFRQPRTWWLIPRTAAAGGLVTWLMTVFPNVERPILPGGFEMLSSLLELNLLLSPFQVVVAMVLGSVVREETERTSWEPIP